MPDRMVCHGGGMNFALLRRVGKGLMQMGGGKCSDMQAGNESTGKTYKRVAARRKLCYNRIEASAQYIWYCPRAIGNGIRNISEKNMFE